MIEIYSPSDVVLRSVPILEDTESVQELMAQDYVQLAWQSDSNEPLPAGAYIIDPYSGERYTLLDPYEPEQKDEAEFSYRPKFQSRVMALGKVPFFHYTYDGKGNITAREPDWVLTGYPFDFMDAIHCAILNETGKNWAVDMAEDVPFETKTIPFSATDIFSALNQIAGEYDTEWLADVKNNVIVLGKAVRRIYDPDSGGTYPDPSETALTVGDNVGAPSVTTSKEGYYNRFYCFGSTRNIAQDYQGANVNNLVNKRLTLDPTNYPGGYIDMPREDGEPIFPKVLTFDDIYPRSDLNIDNVRARLMYRIGEDQERIQVGTDANGNPVYDMYSIWFFQLPKFVLNDSTYSADNPDGMLISGKQLSVHFKSGALNGREFEVIYHPEAKRLVNSDGQDFDVMAGDYEIKFVEKSGFIIPAQTGISPVDGDAVILYNLRMPAEYVSSAYKDLEEAALKHIRETYTDDLNNYTLKSNPVVFVQDDPCMTIGSRVRYVNRDYGYSTRVIKITRKLDIPAEQEIVIGSAKIKGNTATLREEVVNANTNIDILAQLNQLNQSTVQAYQRTQQLILDGLAKWGRLWEIHPTLPNTIYTDYNVLGKGEITAWGEGDGSGSGSGSGAGGGASYLRELLDVSIPGAPSAGQVLMWSASALNGAGGWVASTIKTGLDEAALGTYLSSHNYVTGGDMSTAISNAIRGIDLSDYVTNDSLATSLRDYVTIATDQTITGRKRFAREVTLGTAEDNITLSCSGGALRITGHVLALGEVTAYALAGGGEAGMGLLLGDLADVDAAGAEDGMALVYRDGRWVPGAVAAGGMDESALSEYLTRHDYLTRSTADNRYFYHRRDESGVNIDTGITAVAGGLYELLNPAGALPFGSAGKWYKIMDWGTNNPKYRVQLAAGYSEDHSLFRRQKIGGTWRAWTKILDEANYAEVLDGRYVRKSGDNLTGPLTFAKTSDYSLINGTYNTAGATSNVVFCDPATNRVIYGSPKWAKVVLETSGDCAYRQNAVGTYRIWDEGNDGSGSGLDADMLDGRHYDAFVGRSYGLNMTAGETVDWSTWLKNNSNSITLFSRNSWSWAMGASINMGPAVINTESYGALVFRQGNLYSSWQMAAAMFLPAYTTEKMIYIVRATTSAAAGVLGSQSVLRYADYDTIINGNVATATRLQTARSLWGQPFDGSGDVTGDIVATNFGLSNATANPLLRLTLGTQTYYCQATSHGIALGPTEAKSLLVTAAGSVGVGTVSPAYTLDVAGDIHSDGWLRTSGVCGWYSQTYGGGIYMDSSIWVRIYQKPLYIDAIQTYGANSFGVGLRIYNSYSTSIEVSGGNYTMGLGCHNNGSWYWWRGTAGGGASGKSYVMQYNGSTWQFIGNLLATGEITAYSDARLKHDIRNVVARGRLRPVSYIKDGARHVGLLAQEVEELCPEAVTETETDERYLALSYNAALVYGFAGVYSEIDELRERVRELEAELQRYKRA